MNKLVRLIGHQLRSPRFWAGVLTVAVFAAVIMVLFSMSGHWAFAAGGDNANSTMDDLLKKVWGAAVGAMIKLAAWAVNLFTLIITKIILPNQKDLITGPEVREAWNAIRGISNLLFFIALFVFSIMVITRQGGYNFKKSITALITAAALANLSLEIGLFIIEAGDALRNSAAGLAVFNQPPQADAPKNLQEWFESFSKTMNELENDKGVSLSQYFVATSATLAQIAIMAYVFFRLAFILCERAIRLTLLLIFAPFQAAVSILPQKELQSLGSNWFGEMIKWTLILPVSFIIISIARLLLPNPGSNSLVFKALVENVGKTNDIGGAPLKDIFLLIAGVGVTLAAASTPKMLNLVPQGVASMMSKTQGAITGAGKTAWKYTGGAALGAAGKSIKTNTANIAKNAGYNMIRSTAAGRTLYDWAAGRIEKRKQIPEQQAKQRQLASQSAANIQIRNQYLATKSRVDRIRGDIAARMFGAGTTYSSLTDAQKLRVDDNFRQGGGGVHSGDIENLKAIESKYMGSVSEAAGKEYDIGRSPTDTARLFREAQAKFARNPRDLDAGFEMVVQQEVLRRQGLKVSGAVGEQAAEYYNQIVNNPNDVAMLREAGKPPKFGDTPIRGGASGGVDTVSAYQTLADAENNYTTIERTVQANTNLIAPAGTATQEQAELAHSLATTDETTLRILSDNGANNAAAGLSTVSSASVSHAATLPKEIKERITTINNRRDIDQAGKQTEIQRILESNGVATPDAAGISNAIARGIGIDNLGAAHSIARGKAGLIAGAANTAVINQITNIQQLQEATISRDNAQAQVNSIQSGPGYREAVRNATTATPAANGTITPPVTTTAALASSSDDLLRRITAILGSRPVSTTANLGSLGLSATDHDTIADILRQLHMDTSVSPGHPIASGVDAAQHLNVGQVVSALHQTRQIAQTPRF
jgi:hypothetical protein